MLSFFQMYESIILEAMSLEDIWKKYYEKENISYFLFQTLNSIDPTSTKTKKGKYLDWIIKHAYKENKRVFEDIDKIKEDLELFDKNYRHINKQITQIKDQYELSKLVQEFRKKKESGEIDLSRSEIKKEVDRIYEDDAWLLIHPKTLESAKFYGAGTRWCTAADNNNMFSYYNAQGPLYILINKKDSKEKYQFHFQSEQYMDAEDEPIDRKTYSTFTENVLNIIIKLSKENENPYKQTFIKFLYFIYNQNEDNIKASNFYKQYKEEIDKYCATLNLLRYVENNKIKDVKGAITAGADISYLNYQALEKTVKDNNIEIFKIFTNSGAFDSTNDTLNDALRFVLRFIARNERLGLLRYLFDNKYLDINNKKHYTWYFSEILSNIQTSSSLELLDYLLEKDVKVREIRSDFLNKESVLDSLLRRSLIFRNFKLSKILIEKGASLENIESRISSQTLADYSNWKENLRKVTKV